MFPNHSDQKGASIRIGRVAEMRDEFRDDLGRRFQKVVERIPAGLASDLRSDIVVEVHGRRTRRSSPHEAAVDRVEVMGLRYFVS